jgi:cation diffusion facilitator CzcD-associated flavoprotein CzcO
MSSSATFEATSPAAAAELWVASLSDALASGRPDAIADLFVEDGWWRDAIALSWDIRTLHGRPQIEEFLGGCQPSDLHDLELKGTPKRELMWVQAFFGFRTGVGEGIAVVRLVEREPGRWLAWTLMTALQELTGRELAVGPRRERHRAGHESYAKQRAIEASFHEADPAVLVVGAGQAGLGLAAHLRLMGVPALVIEKNKRVGDNWRMRYDSLVLHDPVWVDSLPFMPFPDSWPVFTPKDKLADWFESYALAMELNIWTGAQLLDATYSDAGRVWTVTVRDEEGAERTLRPRHVVMATGVLSAPNIPTFDGQDEFAGKVLHSTDYDTGAAWAGKKVAVIGACNTGHDIARDLSEHGADVTLIQRSPVYVCSQDRAVPMLVGHLYAEGGRPTHVADLISLSTPNLVAIEFGGELAEDIADADREMLDGLEARGFILEDGVEAGGVLGYALRRGGGYVLDVGSSQRIIDGAIGIATGSVERLTATGVVLDSGREIDADLVVLATGFKNMRESARRIFGDAVADRCGDVWGLDDEGELRSMWRPSGHPGFWFTGGSLLLTRIFSRYLAIQIAASLDGLDRGSRRFARATA